MVCQRDDGRWELAGLTSLGVDQCRFGDQAPTIFVKVGRYIDWILRAGFTKQQSSSTSSQSNLVTIVNPVRVKHLELRSDLETSSTAPASHRLAVLATIDSGNSSSGSTPQLKLISSPSFLSASIPVPNKNRSLLELRELRNDDIRAEY